MLGLALLAGCGAAPGPPVTLRMCFFPVQDFLPYFVMQERRFDKANGLRLEEVVYPGGAAAIDAMESGSLEVCPAVGTVPLLVAAERGLVPGRVLPVAVNNVVDPDHPGIGVVAAHSIRGWGDLKGKEIALSVRNSITGAALLGRLRLEGVGEYSLVEIPFSNMGLAVAGGNVAAAGMNEPFLTQSLLRGDGHLLGWIAGGPPLERVDFSAIAFRTDLARSHPQTVKAFLRAHLQATGWMRDNPAEARAILAQRLNLSPEVGRKVHLLQWPRDARGNPSQLEGMQRVMTTIGMLRGLVPADRIYDHALLDEVLREKR